MDIKPIETIYKGYRFRSRLEARYAVFFDALGIKYEYEKEGFDLGKTGYYLPDFWFPDTDTWAEVKGKEFTDVENKKVEDLCNTTKRPVIKLVGIPEFMETIKGYLLYGDYTEAFETNFIYLIVDREGRSVLPAGFYPKKMYDSVFKNGLKVEYISEIALKMKNACEAAKSARFEHGENKINQIKVNNKPLSEYEIFRLKYCMRFNGHLMEEILLTLENGSPSYLRDKIAALSYIPMIPIEPKNYNYIDTATILLKYLPQEEIRFLLHTVREGDIEYDKLLNERSKSKNKRYPFGYYFLETEYTTHSYLKVRETYSCV